MAYVFVKKRAFYRMILLNSINQQAYKYGTGTQQNNGFRFHNVEDARNATTLKPNVGKSLHFTMKILPTLSKEEKATCINCKRSLTPNQL